MYTAVPNSFGRLNLGAVWSCVGGERGVMVITGNNMGQAMPGMMLGYVVMGMGEVLICRRCRGGEARDGSWGEFAWTLL